ncbi:dynein regulatory complex subunit 4-like [Brachionichthys hirsutus]|uniref:dynein regulatory complex subunit 4-like n=1 Tax=Brachionichthys hirsutus TaxID=412623 RepID=UPI0036046600
MVSQPSFSSPPKTKRGKTGKTKSSPAVDALSVEEMSKDQLEEHIVRLRDELDREQEERIYFQLERDKVRSFWEITRRKQEEAQAQLRNRQREREEAKERHRVEITEFKQKLQHVMCEQHGVTHGLKIDAVASASLVQDQHREAELGLQQEQHSLQATLREKKLHNHRFIQLLKLLQHLELMEQNRRYRSKIQEMEARHQKRRSIMEGEERKLMEEVPNEETKRLIRALLQDQNRSLRDATEFYSHLRISVLEERKELEEDVSQATQQQARMDRKLSAAREEEQHLTTDLQEAQKKRSELLKELEDRAESRTATGATGKDDQAIRDVAVGYELLLQDYEKLQQERDELLRREEETIRDTQQKSDMKRLIMEQKVKALTGSLEKTRPEV